MSKKIIQMYGHDNDKVSVFEIYEKDKEQSLEYFFETYEEAKADMDFQKRINDIAGTHKTREEIRAVHASLKSQHERLTLFDGRLDRLNNKISDQKQQYFKLKVACGFTTLGLLLLMLALASKI